jgi:DNA-directed RNA polymerase subunit L
LNLFSSVLITKLTDSKYLILFKNENDTLGNILNEKLNQMPQVLLSSYFKPHPMIEEIKFTIEIEKSWTIQKVLSEAFHLIRNDVCTFQKDLLQL